ncbi:MAG: ParB/RepB/Spo0J family partition protein [Raoultibacter sp.]
MDLRTVNMSDIYPDGRNPRHDFGDIEALAASFNLNSLNPGEPVNPPVVVQDGSIYRIVDGERRYKGIKHNKLTSCHVIVCEDMDEANTMVAMLATDDKQQLSDVERSRGVQQMLLLGVDPTKVERTARLAKGDAARVRQAMDRVDDAAEDMTLDRMLAIAEFADDAEVVERLTNAPGNEWQWMANNARKRKQDIQDHEAMVEAFGAAGIPVVTDDETDGMRYRDGLRLKQISKYDFPDGAVVRFSSEASTYAWVYAPESEATKEDAAAANKLDETPTQQDPAKAHATTADQKPNASQDSNIETAKHTRGLISLWLSDSDSNDLYEGFSAHDFNETYGTDIKPDITPYTLSLMVDALPYASPWFFATVATGEQHIDADAALDTHTAALLTTMKLDGYAIADIEQQYLDAFNAATYNKTGQEEQCQ